MSKNSILSEYGPERTSGSRARNGGQMTVHSVRDYQPPQGPTEQMRSAVGLGGENCGPCGTQGPASPRPSSSGRAGIGGTNHGCCGSQGKH